MTTATMPTAPHSCFNPIENLPDNWHMCLTQGGWEQRLAEELIAARVDFFLPLQLCIRLRRDGKGREFKQRIYKPLWQTYVFLNGDESREVASRSRAKICIYPVAKKTQPILGRELASIAKALGVNPALGADLHDFSHSQKVSIIAGPYQGVEAWFDRKSDHGRAWLSCTMMGRTAGVPIEMPIEFIEAFDA